jgi:hypothetical protein
MLKFTVVDVLGVNDCLQEATGKSSCHCLSGVAVTPADLFYKVANPELG